MKVRTLGDTAFLIRDENIISPEVNARIMALFQTFKNEKIPGVIDIVPAYCDLKIQYNPLLISHSDLFEKINMVLSTKVSIEPAKGKIHNIPVVYGGDYGVDLEYLLSKASMSRAQFIEYHTSPEYLIYMIGFSPGFPYLGGMDKRIACDRKQTPSLKILAGSVGIAGTQTGIYTVDSPGGWQIIGRTPSSLFDPERNNPFLLNHGDFVKFYEIDADQFNNY